MTLGMLLAVSSSSAAMTAIIDTLNNAYDIEEERARRRARGEQPPSAEEVKAEASIQNSDAIAEVDWGRVGCGGFSASAR